MSKTKKITVLSLFTAIAVVLGIFEASLPFVTSIPGGKLGLANALIIIIMYKYGNKNALAISILRALIVCLLHSGANALIYSVSGAFVSTLLMIIAKKTFDEKVTPIGLSVLGAFFHNLTQVAISALMLNSFSVFYYFSILASISVASGILTGICAKYFIEFTKGEYYK